MEEKYPIKKEVPIKYQNYHVPIKAEGKKVATDPNGFEYFDQLPQDIKLAIFDYFPFSYWVSQLSPVSASWRKLVTQCNRRKILVASEFENYRRMPFKVLITIAKNYQIYGINIDYYPATPTTAQIAELLAASKQINWVVLPEFRISIKEVEMDKIPTNTVSSVAFESWTEYLSLKFLFPNITQLKVCDVGVHKCLEHFCHPNLKTLHTLVQSLDDAANLLNHIKSVAPKIEAVHVQEDASRRSPVPKRKKIGLTKISKPKTMEKVEEIAAQKNIKFYCGNLYQLFKNPDQFIESYVKQGLPYSYYVKPDTSKTLFKAACRKKALPIIKFLLDNGVTTIDREYEYHAQSTIFDSVIYVGSNKKKKKGTSIHKRTKPLLLSYKWTLDVDSIATIDYLLAKGFDVNRLVKGESLFCHLNPEIIAYILEHAKVDLEKKIDKKGNTVLHYLMKKSMISALKVVIKQLSEGQRVELFGLQNNEGETPLHKAKLSQADMLPILFNLTLGPVWDIPDFNGHYPLPLLLRGLKGGIAQMLHMLMPIMPSVAPGLVSTVFECVKELPDEYIKLLDLLADHKADFNEVIGGVPAITKFSLISVPVLCKLADLGVNFNVADTNGETLLFHLQHNLALPEIAEILVKEYGLNINHVNKEGVTPLYGILKMCNIPHIAKFLELGADPNHASGTSCPLTLVNAYFARERKGVIELLLKAGANPNIKLYNETNTMVVMPLVSLLHNSTESGLLDLFVKYGADLNMKDGYGNSLLHLLKKDEDIAYLLNHLDPYITNSQGQTPLWNNSIKSPQSFEKIIKKADPNIINHVANNGGTILHANINLNYFLSFKNIDLSIVDKRGQSFLHGNSNIQTYNRHKILQSISNIYSAASDEMKAKITKAFNHVDCYDFTVLHYICCTDLESTQLMVENFGLDVNPSNKQLTLSLKFHPDVIEYLLKKGCNPNKQSALTGDTFLHQICGSYLQADLIRMLLKYGASVDIKNFNGISPADIDPNLKTGYNLAVWTSGVNGPKKKSYITKKKVESSSGSSSSGSYSDSESSSYSSSDSEEEFV